MRTFFLLLLISGAAVLGVSSLHFSTARGFSPVATQAISRLKDAARQAPAFTATAESSTQNTSSVWREVASGVQMRRFQTQIDGVAVSVIALRAAPSRIRITTGANLDATAWRQKQDAVAVANGGFFDPANRSLGLRISRGRQTSSLRAAEWGVFYVRRGRARILHTTDWKKLSARRIRSIREAIQCGPRLVVDGRVLRLKPQWARRTGIGIMRDGRVVLAITEDEVSFRGWANLWARRDGLDCVDALNLDGGGSTQLSLKSRRENIEVGGAWPVPDAVAIQ